MTGSEYNYKQNPAKISTLNLLTFRKMNLKEKRRRRVHLSKKAMTMENSRISPSSMRTG